MIGDQSIALRIVSYYEETPNTIIPFSTNEVLFDSVESALRWIKAHYSPEDCCLNMVDDEYAWGIVVAYPNSDMCHYPIRSWKQVDIIILEERKHLTFAKSVWDNVMEESEDDAKNSV